MTRRVLVTAGAAGIGLEIARAFHAEGASIFICDIDEGALKSAQGELAGALVGGRIRSPEAAARKAVTLYGRKVRANRKRLA
jgi:NAD(P)-dependent dehydrogenase (short-subunit alcohol dehydrogenase family)